MLFSQLNVITMKANIIAIGNSKGLIIPSALLRRLNITDKTCINISVENNEIVLKPIRQGWEEIAKEMRENEDDSLLMDESLTSFEKEDWTW
jgi:antitoxin MazE